ncbi:hypothetical protein HYQ45_008238 [Verticillium longisporum]|uniref:Uncharacterized protein n=1 Tax=Verticillium longisporum TaxID=100787 RepID=A0A8I3APD4_VERLO|nr:hypothetical protein HYQ45_008238 [Verticillium longisporum]
MRISCKEPYEFGRWIEVWIEVRVQEVPSRSRRLARGKLVWSNVAGVFEEALLLTSWMLPALGAWSTVPKLDLSIPTCLPAYPRYTPFC